MMQKNVRVALGGGPAEMEHENGILRFARLTPAYAGKRLPDYAPENDR